MGRERVQTRADPDTYKKIVEYQEERGLSHSEAVRRLLRAGIQKQEEDSPSFWQKLFTRSTESETYESGLALDTQQVLTYAALLYIAVMVTLLVV